MVLTHRERTEKAKTQREQAEARVREGKQLPPLPAPGVYARHNAVDIPGLLPDGTTSELTVSPTLRERGQIRDVVGRGAAPSSPRWSSARRRGWSRAAAATSDNAAVRRRPAPEDRGGGAK